MNKCGHHIFALILLTATAVCADFNLQTDYQNVWFNTNQPQGAVSNWAPVGTICWGGHAGPYHQPGLGYNGTNTPAGGGFQLAYSAFGHPAEESVPDFELGAVISPPRLANTNVAPAYIFPSNTAFYASSVKQVFAADGGSLLVDWIMNDGSTNRLVYFISSIPARRPARLFWTESPWYAPKVDLTDKHVTLHYNSVIPPPPDGVAASNYTSTVWVEDNNGAKLLHAVGCSGLMLVEYFETGDKLQQVGIEIVEIGAPEIHTQAADIGRRILPRDDSYGYDDLQTRITRGQDASPHKVYKHASSDGKSAREGWLFPIWGTMETPWEIEVYWEHKGLMDVVWPFEVDWYAADWPADSQIYVRGTKDGDIGAPVLIPAALNCEVMPFEEPSGIGTVSNHVFRSSGEGYTLLKYYTGEEVWFEAVHSVFHTNHFFFDLAEEDWEVGKEIVPADIESAIDIPAGSSYVLAPSGWTVTGRLERTIECWANVRAFNGGGLFESGARASGRDFSMRTLDSNEWFRIQLYGTGYDVDVQLPGSLDEWHHYALTYDGGTVRLYYDGSLATSHVVSLNTGSGSFYIGRWATDSLDGQLDEVRAWNRARSSSQIRDSMERRFPQGHDDLLADYTFQEASGSMAYDRAGGHHAQIFGSFSYIETDRRDIADPWNWDDFPGYVYAPEGDSYNIDLYSYPTTDHPDAQSFIFGVQSNILEVWWAEENNQENMPAPVYWPALVNRYQLFWPSNTTEIVIAGQNSNQSGAGSLADTWLAPSIYYQNDPDAPGYNPNEEHALIMGDDVYVLRDDLNEPDSSPPFVLLQYTDTDTGEPAMHLFSVVRTNEEYSFNYDAEVGQLLQPPMPLAQLSLTEMTHCYRGPVWRDKNNAFWAYAAERYSTGTVDVLMRYFYPMQASFNFPSEEPQPPEGFPVPWLSGNGLGGKPVDVTYTVSWPDDAPVLHVADTLVRQKNGLPDIDEQLSVTMLYQESQYTVTNVFWGTNITKWCVLVELPTPFNDFKYCWDVERIYKYLVSSETNRSVMLIDPTQPRTAALAEVPDDITTHIKDSKKFFPDLPPQMYERVYHDPNIAGGSLVLKGEYVEPAAGEAYLLMNVLSDDERAKLQALSTDADWLSAVGNLPSAPVEITDESTPFDSLALSAGIGQGTGYVVFAANNSTNLAPPGSPVSLYVIRVEAPLYQGEIKDIFPDNPLDEQLTLRHSGDFAGHPENYEFEWKRLPPADGMAPTNDPTEWISHSNGVGALYVTIGRDTGILVIEDQYFICRYRPLHPDSPVGTNTWSEWTDAMLAPGWVQRVMNAINPFEQRVSDLENQDINTLVHMIGEAGKPYVGDVALNMDHINDYGLIELYQTVFNRAADLSIESGIDDSSANDALKLAATRIHDLYMLLGNEAYADSQDPTIAFSSRDDWVGYESYVSEATSIFCFMNQVPDLLAEELALLRGRDEHFDPSIETFPIYNRLIWNFTKGIDGGELAYALNYNIMNQDGSLDGEINELDAAVLYPQGHGDAWGHYLSAIKTYYHLLNHSNYTWSTDIGAMVLGGVTVNLDYYDEQKFAEAAAAQARTGSEILKRTYQSGYEEHQEGLYSGLRDSSTNRAWGLAEWASRAGQAALFNWAAGNSLLAYEDTNTLHEGIQIIDRQTVNALQEVAACAGEVQDVSDRADQNLNPLGLAQDAIPFDISPADIDAGKTHFEQIYDRALTALNNANTAFDYAKAANLRLRAQAESLYNFQIAHREREIDYNNRLIEIFGYPYADDIGPGKTYPASYEGPDLYHALYLDMSVIPGISVTVTPVRIRTVSLDVDDDDNWTLNRSTMTTVTFHFAQNGYMVKPPEWTGTRRASGDIQRNWTEFVRGVFELKQSATEYNNLYADLKTQYDFYVSRIETLDDMYDTMYTTHTNVKHYAEHIQKLKQAALFMDTLAEIADKIGDGIAEGFPEDAGLANDLTSTARAGFKLAGTAGYAILKFVIADALEADALKHERENEDRLLDMELDLRDLEREDERARMEAEMRIMIRQLSAKEQDVLARLESLSALQGAALAKISEGERLLNEREFYRSAAAARIQRGRYADMTFRIMRDDALQKYQAAFDMAARYVYLAAKAYDYETALLDTDAASTPGSRFLAQIAKSRCLGIIQDSLPLVSRNYGDAGLADAMARMKADWDVVKTRFGFNNPETETSRFSLRSEMLRISPLSSSDTAWQNALEECRVDDVTQLPDFQRYCRPFTTVTNSQPALVIPFSTIIDFGKNYFGHNLAGGDNAYDSSHAATKVRSAGIWFTGYNSTFNTNDLGGGLANEPRVYLFPCGIDVMRTPTGDGETLRTWTVFDQALPLPYNIGDADLDDPDWIPINDSLSEDFAKLRRFASLRAYHDSGDFDASETDTNGRLIGRSVWNSQWYLVIPGGTLLSDPVEGINRFIYGAKLPDGSRDGNGIKDIKVFFQTYSVSGE